MPIRNHEKKALGTFALSSFEHRSPSGFHKRLLEICAFIVNIVLKRSEHEKQLQENQEQLEILGLAIKYASDGMIITDTNNIIIEVNNAFMQTFGYEDKKEVIGQNPRMLSSKIHDHHFYEQMWKSIIEEKHWSGEIWNKRKSGDIFLEWMSISTISDDDNSIKNYLAIFTDLSEFKENQEKLVHLAYYDQLTTLPNRQKIIADIQDSAPKGCAIFNIDNFKEINDFFGLKAGDEILRQLGEWFTTINCHPYRIGGDEFAVLFFEEMEWSDIEQRITSVLTKLEEKSFSILNESINIGLSVGVAIGGNKLLTHADIALHSAKEKKIPVALYEEHHNVEEAYRTNIAMAGSIRKALAQQRIICHYQPIVNITTGSIDKYETLVRMIDEDGTLIPPLAFLSIAKKTKLYPQITREVVAQACQLFANRSEEFSINLSDSDIRDPFTVSEIIRIITQTNTGSRIVFEILESEGIENFDEVARFISHVKALGAKIAIDDFGTGYSNFENILKLGVDFIKIDGSLIVGITNNERHRIIVDTIVDFARKIGAKTIAEFVSDEAIYNAVIEHKIDYSQGYFTGKPQLL
jgi:PAS domain S-box-containing protein/diguanylate cyclase (GGDEF)-like protein